MALRVAGLRRAVRTLSGLAVAEPTFSSLTDSTGVLVPLRLDRLIVVEFVLLVILVPPLVLWVIEVLVGLLSTWARRLRHRSFAGLLAAIFAIECAKQIPYESVTPSGPVLVLIGIGAFVAMFALMSWKVARAMAATARVRSDPVRAPIRVVRADVESARPREARPLGGVPRQPHRVVVVVMDELPETSLLDGRGQVDRQLFPNFAAFAAASTWYRNDTTAASFTEGAVPAILSGIDPVEGRTGVVADYPHNLFTLLGGHYHLNVHETLTRLCPAMLCRTLAVPGARDYPGS